MNEQYIYNMLKKLSNSKFRNSFHLSDKDKNYIKNKGLDTIRIHAYDLITKRLKGAIITNDGHQTPFRGHPVFIAQHATATCCRGCLYKWHNIMPGIELSNRQIEYIIEIIMKWIEKNY